MHTHTQPVNIGDTGFSSSEPRKTVPVQDLANEGLVGGRETSMLRSSGRRERSGGRNGRCHEGSWASPVAPGRRIHHHQ